MKIDLLEHELFVHHPDVLDALLKDRTCGRNIIWATDDYAALGAGYGRGDEITWNLVTGAHGEVIQPRVCKSKALQQQRVHAKGEVFTPLWIVNRMVNHLDELWFGRPNIFNCRHNDPRYPRVQGKSIGWQEPKRKKGNPRGLILFPADRTWQDYVRQTCLEPTCGEAPFLTTRYDPATGRPETKMFHRVGVLDRKFRVVTENTATAEDWLIWGLEAVKSVYGFEWQGDNVLLARENIYASFIEYFDFAHHAIPPVSTLRELADIISWNIWQMDGLKDVPPFDPIQEESLFAPESSTRWCKIRDWRTNATITYHQLKRASLSGDTTMNATPHFNFVIGNPPYQDETVGDQKNYAPPIYDKFMDEVRKVADKVELITPARFLFNAGSTPKEWNKKMLNDPHFKVLFYEADSAKVFPSTDIKGGVAISYIDSTKGFEPIGVFIVFTELNSILRKVKAKKEDSFSELVYAPESYRFTEKMHKDFPNVEAMLSKGHKYDFKSNVLSKLKEIVFFGKPQDEDKAKWVQILGLVNTKREFLWIRREYIQEAENFTHYKIFVPESNGTGAIGEVLSTPLIGQPLIGHTQTFISIGNYTKKSYAEACLKYVKTKFARAMLGTLKITQHNAKATWRNVPLQDFTETSDIDWTKSVAEIDQQLYKKYDLTREEIEFIETHVREMV